MSKLIRLTPEDLIKKISLGERDFSGILLENTDINSYPEFNESLRALESYNPEDEIPFNFRDSRFSNVRANGLYLPYGLFNSTIFEKCEIKDGEFIKSNLESVVFFKCDLHNSDFNDSSASYMKMIKSNASYTEWDFCDLTGSKWYKVNLEGSSFNKETVFDSAKLRRIYGIEKSELPEANLKNARIGCAEKHTIAAIRRQSKKEILKYVQSLSVAYIGK